MVKNVIQIDIVVLLVNILVDVLATTTATVMSKVTDVVTDTAVINHVFYIYIENYVYKYFSLKTVGSLGKSFAHEHPNETYV